VAVLRAATRNRLPGSAFALPGRRYPVHDRAHARAALSYGARYASPSQLATIRSKVHARFPTMGKKKGKLASHMTRMKLAGKFGGQKGGY